MANKVHPEILAESRKAIGQQLLGLKKEAGLTTYRLAQITGLTERQLKTIETGQAGYNMDSLASYAGAVNARLIIEGEKSSVFVVIKESDKLILGCFDKKLKAVKWAGNSYGLIIKELKVG